MKIAAKEKTFLLLAIVSALLVCAPAFASKAHVLSAENRVEIFSLGGQNRTEQPPLSLETASSYYNALREVALESLVVPKGGVIGRLDDLRDLRPGEYTLLDRLQGNLGSPKANWQRNSSVLRDEIRRGVPIRDASARLADSHILDNGVAVRNTFLGAERNTLRNKGWTFDGKFWNPPTP